MQKSKRPGRKGSGDPSITPDDLGSAFHDAIWDAAGKFEMEDSKGRKQKKSELADNLVWRDSNVLSFEQFCASPEHMNFPTLSPRQARVAQYMFGDNPKKIFDTNRNTAVLVWGKGSGKDTISALMILYVTYVLLCMRNPQQFLEQKENSSIDLLNVASSKEQARDVFFDILKTMVLHWPWLRARYSVNISGRSFMASHKTVDEYLNRVVITNDAIVFPNRIRAFSGSSEAEALEGKNLLMFVLDEADAFKERSDHRSAEKIYRMCRSSAFSRFGNKFKGFVISYPRSKEGFIMSLYERTKRFLNVYSDIAKTWEVKPRDKFSKETFEFEGHQVPLDFYEEFQMDPIGAKRAYMCLAPMAEDTFLKDRSRIESAVVENRAPLFTFKDFNEDGYIRKRVLERPYIPNHKIRHYLFLDLGLTDNAACLTMLHRNDDKIVMDFTTVWVPDKKKGIRVDHINVLEIVLEICKSVTVGGLYGDHWNSPMFIQKVQRRGIHGETVKLNYEDYLMFRRMLYSGHIELLQHSRLLDELKNLTDVNRKKVDHPSKGHDDMAVTVVMGTKILIALGKESGATELAAEGEYVGNNINEAYEIPNLDAEGEGFGIQIDGIPL